MEKRKKIGKKKGNANSLIISSHHHLSRPAESCLFVDLSADHSMVLEVRDTDKKSLGA